MLKTAIDTYSGDNFIIEATITIEGHECSARTIPLICWKRVYVEVDAMCKKGSTLMNSINHPTSTSTSNCNGSCEVVVNDVTDIEVGSQYYIKENIPGNPSSTLDGSSAIITVTAINPAESSIQIEGLTSNNIFYKYAAILPMVITDEDLFLPEFSLMTHAYGLNPDGADGGAFTEFNYLPQQIIPKMIFLHPFSEFTNQFYIFNSQYTNYDSFPNGLSPIKNLIRYASASRMNPYNEEIYNRLSITDTEYHIRSSNIFNSTILVELNNPNSTQPPGCTLLDPATSFIPYLAEVAAHEISHLIGLPQGAVSHIDSNNDVPDILNEDKCTMTYLRCPANSKAKFDEFCYSKLIKH